MARSSSAAPRPLVAGPFKGVYDTNDPYDSSPKGMLARLRNGYIPDPDHGSGVYGRPGFQLANSGVSIDAGVNHDTPGEDAVSVTKLDGTILNFVLANGKLYRLTDPFNSVSVGKVDVSPVGITINNLTAQMSTMVALVGGVTQTVLVVNDGVNRPWVGTNLSSTPITGTYIDYDGLGTAWTAWGRPTVWQGALLFILKTVGGVGRREDISWSEPGDPFTGWQQTAFDNNYSLVTHATGPLTALAASNTDLTYFRAGSIGTIAGDIGDLVSTNTDDLVADNIGTLSDRTIQRFGDALLFADTRGRVHLYRRGAPPIPLWQQMRRVVDQFGAVNNNTLERKASSAIDPEHNLYLVTIWLGTEDVGTPDNGFPRVIYVFDARTGRYVGEWSIYDDGQTGGIDITAMAAIADAATGERKLILMGRKAPGTSDTVPWSFLWYRSGEWYDTDGVTPRQPDIEVLTDRLGESARVAYNISGATITTGSDANATISVSTATQAMPLRFGGPVQPVSTPGTSKNGSYTLTVGLDAFGRGPQVRVLPSMFATPTTISQWSLHRIEVDAAPSGTDAMDN